MFKRFYLPLLLLFSMVPTCIEVDVSVPGFPDIATFFLVPEGVIHLTVALNFLGFCLGAITYGPLSDVYGRRSIMLSGMFIMVLSL